MPLVSYRVAEFVVGYFHFSKTTPKSLTSNPITQFALSNPRSQPDTHFAVDMFPYKKTESFQRSGFQSQLPKKPGNTPLSGCYLSFRDKVQGSSALAPLARTTAFLSSDCVRCTCLL